MEVRTGLELVKELFRIYLKEMRGIIAFFDEVDANEWDEGMRSICDVKQFAAADGPDEPLSK